MNGLVERFRRTCRGVGAGAPDERITDVAAGLLARWAEPHRHYHDVRHLESVLDVVDEHADAATNPDRVRLAAWWHDAIYDPRATGDSNERDSAALAGEQLAALGVPPTVVRDVARLVLVTARHAADPGDRDAALLCDADLAVLARPAAEYDAYAAAVRREYAHVPDAAFAAGRAAVLRQLLALPRLFAMLTDLEAPARANLARELG